MRILFVCTGNTCRSPMAQALMVREAERRGLSVEVDSVGLGTQPGDVATDNAAKVMAARGLEIAGRPAQQAEAKHVEQAELVLAMTERHAETLRQRLPQVADRIFSLGEYIGTGEDVQDPYGANKAVYERTAQQLERMLAQAAERLFRPTTDMV